MCGAGDLVPAEVQEHGERAESPGEGDVGAMVAADQAKRCKVNWSLPKLSYDSYQVPLSCQVKWSCVVLITIICCYV